jgi:urease accessory protein
MSTGSAIGRDDRLPAEVGRRARLELVFGFRDGRTVLVDSYAEPPLRVGRCFENGRGLHLILASSAPGIFGGDAIRQTIRLEPGAIVTLTSQSATQLHPAQSGAVAVIDSRYDVADGAELSCNWDPMIPFAGACIEQRIDITVASGGRLTWSDAMMGGRAGRGERWQFRIFDHQLRLFRSGTLSYLERYRLDPSTACLSHPWAAADAAYIGTLLRAGHGDSGAVADLLHTALAGLEEVRGSADVLDRDLLLARIAAAGGVAFRRARQALAETLPSDEAGQNR